jgi:hypothetical protein
MIFSSRKRGVPGPYLDWKVRLFFLGAALALIGIGVDSSLLVGLATGVLILGVGLRFWPGGNGRVEAEDDDQWEALHEEENPGSPPPDDSPTQN